MVCRARTAGRRTGAFALQRNPALPNCCRRHKAGTPKLVAKVQLKGLRTWSVRGFDEFRIYYLVQDDLIKVIRVLHGKRDIASILERETVDQAREKDRL